MCGRYSIYDIQLLEMRFSLPQNFKPIYNAAPSMDLPISTDGKSLTYARWGFVPQFHKQDEKLKIRPINAKAESLSKPFFSKAQRCIIPADGFYEWQKKGEMKIPFRIELRTKKLMFFAGIFTTFDDQKTFAIITTSASDNMKSIHDRMPVILDEENKWITKFDESLLRPNDGIVSFQISTKVNSPKNNTKEILEKTNTLFNS